MIHTIASIQAAVAREHKIPNVCPNCCLDLSPFEPIEHGPLCIPDRVTFIWNGVPIKLTGQQRLILLALIRAGGEIIKRTALMEAIGTDTDARDQTGVVDVQITHIRAAFRKVDPEFGSLQTVWGEGVRWAA
jgi:two-component system response regulator ChvI